MAIPTKEQFDESIDAIAKIRSNELRDEVSKLTLHEEAISALLKKHHEIISSKSEQARSLYAHNWLLSQQYGREAIDKYVKHREQKKIDKGYLEEEHEWVKNICRDITTEYVQQRIQEDPEYYKYRVRGHGTIEEYVAYCNTENEKTKRVINWLSWKIEQPRGKWLRGVFIALRNYHYTNRWINLVTEHKSRIAQLNAALDALEALRSLSSNLIEPTSLGMGPKSYARMRFTIENQIRADVTSIYPVERNDKTARERVLAYDLYLNNEREFDEPKRSIIHCLMNLDGIENKIERRTLDSMLSKWREARDRYNKDMKESYGDDEIGYILDS